MRLSELIQPFLIYRQTELARDPDIRSIHYRSDEVRPGGLFVAIPGLVADGHDFIPDAVRRGAAAILTQKPVIESTVTILQASDTRKLLGPLAARLYGHPSDDLFIIGITGTNGKTTTSLLVESILTAAGHNVGVIGTIDYHYNGRSFDNPVTTPESLDLQRMLREMRDAGVTHVVIEVSSHAIDLHRVNGCHFDIGVFTNLTQDHLDYHKTMADYWACKRRLFTEHLPGGPKADRSAAVVNQEDPKGWELAAELKIPCITTGYSRKNVVWADGFEYTTRGIDAELVTPSGEVRIHSPLIGRHNLSNILSAAGVAVAMNLPMAAIQNGIAALSRVAGRLDPVSPEACARVGFNIYVDYAHTPDALANVLTALRPLTTGRLICVFGCGGDRDPTKRPLMGGIVAQNADLAVVTSDNPRTEPPARIIDQILPGVIGALRETGGREYRPDDIVQGIGKRGFVTEPDRRTAIQLALAAARSGDIVLIAGKGHETYQIVGTEKLPFDDRAEAKAALERIV